MAIRYVPAAFCVDKAVVDKAISTLRENDDVPLELIVMIDHAYHNEDENYDGGLSFFDRLEWKLGLFFELGWTAEELKSMVRDAPEDYMRILGSVLDAEKIDVYGV